MQKRRVRSPVPETGCQFDERARASGFVRQSARNIQPSLAQRPLTKMMPMIDHLESERFSPMGDTPVLVLELDQAGAIELARHHRSRTRAIIIGIDRSSSCPAVDLSLFDLLLSTRPEADRPWVAVMTDRLDRRIAEVRKAIDRAPIAAATVCQVLRISGGLAFSDALNIESTAYSMLLSGAEFRSWLETRVSPDRAPDAATPVRMWRNGNLLNIALAAPLQRNAIDARMRDALFEALAAALDDPTQPLVRLTADGACFSTGGDLGEFGTAADLAEAHFIRMLRSNAVLLHELGARAETWVHGACIGSGIEIPAAAARLMATEGAFFQLPEIRMGLIPGAGGTVTIARRIGRHRTCYLALSAARLRATEALAWGLIDGIGQVP